MAIKDTIKNAGIALLEDLLVFRVLGKKKDTEGKTVEEAGKMAKTLAPHILGLGPEDEAIFNATLAKLDYGMNIHIGRALEKLSNKDRTHFIMKLSVIPDEMDRINVLKMYGKLPIKDMIRLAKNSRMLDGEGISEHITSILKQSGLDQKAGKIASEIARKNKQFKQRRDKSMIKFSGLSIRGHRLFPTIAIPKFKLYK